MNHFHIFLVDASPCMRQPLDTFSNTGRGASGRDILGWFVGMGIHQQWH
ncbi:hypothetical protein LINPERPRIM_LOCUS40428 [Linum perenne]